MFLRYIALFIFALSIIAPQWSGVFAMTEIVFDNPTFGDISGTAAQAWGVSNSFPIAGNNDNSPTQYCIEQGLYLAYYTVGEPSPFGTKAAFNTGSDLWETTGGTTKLASQIICSTLPIVWISHVVAWTFVNNYWDTNFPGSASGSVSDIKVKARVNPVLNLAISVSEIDLGILTAGVASTGSLNLEIGTNALSGVSITARSQSGGLTNVSDNDIQISSITDATDPVAENYTWASTALTGVASDSSYGAAFTASGLTALEIVDDTTEHTVYTTNNPEATSSVDDVEFIVSATPTAETPAGDYQDCVTFTVTGNF